MTTTMTIVETAAEDRLRPLNSSLNTNETTENNKSTNCHHKNILMRTSSLYRLRQFPTYFCRQGSTEIAEWLASSKIRLSSYLTLISKQSHEVLLAASIYCAITLLTIQLLAGLLILLSVSLPSGLLFLLACTVLIAYFAVRLLNVTNIEKTGKQRKSRSRFPVDRKKVA